MSKDLPYFRLTVQEWQNGYIMLESDSVQGVFMSICCYYWSNNCEVATERLLKRFKGKKKIVERLLESEIIKQENGYISINFLDLQLKEIQKEKKFYSDMGKKGQEAKKKKAPLVSDLKPPLSNKEKDKEKDKDKIGKSKKFIKPTIQEIRSYCQERKNMVDSETFFNFYESKGWLIGKNLMKDWKAAVRTWEKKMDSGYKEWQKVPAIDPDRPPEHMIDYSKSHYDGEPIPVLPEFQDEWEQKWQANKP